MENITREIEQRQMEIQTMAQQKVMELDEQEASRIYEKISVPANLSEILSTIQNIQSAEQPKPIEIDDEDDDDEYVPMTMSAPTTSVEYRASSSSSVSYSAMPQHTSIVTSMMDIDERMLVQQDCPPPPIISLVDNQPSRLANMSEEDLLKMVPDGMDLGVAPSSSLSLEMMEAPPPPNFSQISESQEPAIPGLDSEYGDMEH